MIFIDFAVTENCENPETYGVICHKCNKCGRFDEHKKEETDKEKEQ